MALNQGKYKPTICAIDEVDDRSYKLHTGQDDERSLGHGQSKQQIEGSETAPLTTNQQKLHMDDAGLTPKELEAARKEALSEASGVGGVTPTANTPNSTHASANGLRGKERGLVSPMSLNSHPHTGHPFWQGIEQGYQPQETSPTS